MIVDAMIENLVTKIFDGALEGIEKKITEKNFEKEIKKQIKALLEELMDAPFYHALDSYITVNGTVQKITLYCDNYTDKKIKISDFLESIVSDFLSQNENLGYINMKYLKVFFEDLFNEIFNIRYHYEKNTNQEIIIARLKREIENENSVINNNLSHIEKQLEKIHLTICQDDITINDKRFQFLEKYNNRLFLENDNEKSIKLKDIYVAPRYRENGEIKNNICQYIHEFMFEQREDNVLFIVGQPTVGKSSLICDLVSRYIYRNDIIALQFKELDESKDLVNALKSKLQFNDKDFAGKILILDGLDEAKICKNKDINHIDKICRDFIHDLQNLLPSNTFFRVMLTIRTDFFKLKWKDDYEKVRVIELVEFNRNQIKDFQQKYLAKRSISQKILKFIERELSHKKLGIISNPMMLYMICCCEDDLSYKLNKSDIYNSIFNENSPLFLNLYKGKGYAENKDYIEKYYNIIGKIAFEMYAKSTFLISEEEVRKLIPDIDNNLKSFTGMAILSKNDGEFEFIHSTIGAYFAAKYIYRQLLAIYQKKINSNGILKIVDEIFSQRDVEGEVLDFLQYFIEKGNIGKQEKKIKTLLNATPFILERNCINSLGLEYDASLLERIHNAFNGYWKIFTSIYLQINKGRLSLKDLFLDDKKIWKNLSRLLKNGSFNKLYLKGAEFGGADLRCVILSGADISFSNLNNADLRGASLVGAKLCNSNLDSANFNGADLCKADLGGASLKRLKVRGSVLKECKFRKNKNVFGIKFSYSNIFFVQNIKEEDLENCFVYDVMGKMKSFKEWNVNKTEEFR